jgi:RTX calcium-binding nonapeptide repeat (4 copies)
MTAPRTRRFQPACEVLEERRLLATALTASLSGGILTVTGTPNNDSIVVLQDPRSNQVLVRDNMAGRGTDTLVGAEIGTLVPISVKGKLQNSVAADKVVKVQVDTGAGNDTLNLNYVETFTGKERSLAVQVAAEARGAGSDLFIGGAGDTEFFGGSGRDRLYGANGTGITNILHGGPADSLLVGGGGTDVTNVLHGGGGDDKLVGGSGHGVTNKLYGGTGEDVLVGGNGINYLNGGGGHDTFKGGSGTNYYHEDFATLYNGPVDYRTIYQGRDPLTNDFVAALTAVARQSPADLQNITTLSQGKDSTTYGVPFYWNGAPDGSPQRVKFTGDWTDSDPMPSLDAQGRVTGESWVLVTWQGYKQFLQKHYVTPADMNNHWTVPDVFNALLGKSTTLRGTKVIADGLTLDFGHQKGGVVSTKGCVDGGSLAASTDYAVLSVTQDAKTKKTMVTLRRAGQWSADGQEFAVELNSLVSNLASLVEAGPR